MLYIAQGRGSSRHRDYENSATAVRPGAPVGHNPTPEDLQHERVLKWTPNDIGPAVAESPMAAISLPPEVKPAMEEFQKWLASEAWFTQRRVPWRRGWLLHGEPGTGKTSFVRALAQLADLPIFSFDLSSLSNEEMVEKWLNMLESVPCVALMEDIDAVFDGRVNILGEQGGGLTYDCLLNCISGIQTADGVFLIVTTNNLEKVDPALGIPDNGKSTRPGRIDRLIELPVLPRECRQEIAERILDEWPEIIPSLLESSEGYTGAQFTELCVAEALSRFWSGASTK
jgi:ATPases of the AAA+ class